MQLFSCLADSEEGASFKSTSTTKVKSKKKKGKNRKETR